MAHAGARFETYIRAAMTEAELPSLAELYRESGIAASTWSGWFRGVSTPRRNSMVLAGRALNRTPEQLLAAWDGATPQKARRATEPPDPILAAIGANTTAVNALVALLTPLLGDTANGVVGRLDKLDDRVERLSRQAIGAPPKPPVPQETAG